MSAAAIQVVFVDVPTREPTRRPPAPPMPTNCDGGGGFAPCGECTCPVTCRAMGACYEDGR